MNRFLLAALLAPAAAQAAPLTVVDVAAPAINCLFSPSCKVTVTDKLNSFPMNGYNGLARLQTRSFTGQAGTPGAGLAVTEYRLDLSDVGYGTFKGCVDSLKVNFSAPATLSYKPGTPAQIFVITSGGLGAAGLKSADLTAGKLVMYFQDGMCPGKSSFFLGMAGAAKGAAADTTVTATPSISVEVGAPSD